MRNKLSVLMVGGMAAFAAARPATAQNYGAAVAISGADILVGDLSDRQPGAVLVYRKAANGTWTERARLAAASGRQGDRFGAAIAADGDQVLVGANRGGAAGTGAAYVLRRDRRGAWTESATLLPGDSLARADGYGSSVAIGGEWAAVGAPARDSARGTVYLFRRSGERWSPAGQVAAGEPATNERFGGSLSLQGDRLIVGANGRERGTGAAYVFRLDAASGRWSQEARLLVNGLAANARLGWSVAQAGDLVLAAAPWQDQFSGAIHVFRKDSTGTWVTTVALRPMDQQRNLRFGTSLSFDGTDLYVGAPGAERFAGAVYHYKRNPTSGAWVSGELIRSAGLEAFDQFAGAVAAAGPVLVAAAAGDDHGAGTALVFEADRAGALRETSRIFSVAPAMETVTGSERRCDGHAAIFNCSNVDLLAFLPIQSIGGGRGVDLNDIWGWTDPTTGREYALVGRIDGTSFVDVTEPTRPVYLGDLPMTQGARANAWRDIKVYRDHAFIVADGAGPHGMQVFDLTQLRTVRPGQPQTFRETAHYSRIASAHNIVINEESGFAYAVGSNSGGETCGGGLHMIDIRTPTQPTFAGCFQDTNTGNQRTGYSHDAQCVMYHGPDQRYRGHEICLGSNETALSIADVTDKQHPVAISSASYPNVSYAHQGWLTDDHRYFYMDDEGDEASGKVSGTRTLIWDLSDLTDPVLAGQYIAAVRSIDHNLYVRGDLVFESNYTSGLRILDISNRTSPREVGFLDTYPFGDDEPSFAGTWSNYPYFRSGTVVVTGIGEGLFVVRPRVQPTIP